VKKKYPLLLTTALKSGSSLQPEIRPGLDALIKADRQLVAESERPKVGDSLDLDAATVQEFPNDHRWDYLLSVPAASRIIGVEPHSAKDSEIRVVIAKKSAAVVYLRDHLVSPHRIAAWYWVCQGAVGFSRMERARRILDQAGIEFAGRALRKLG
jgi:hypothetical protein